MENSGNPNCQVTVSSVGLITHISAFYGSFQHSSYIKSLLHGNWEAMSFTSEKPLNMKVISQK